MSSRTSHTCPPPHANTLPHDGCFTPLQQTSVCIRQPRASRPDACNCPGRLVPTKGHGSSARSPAALFILPSCQFRSSHSIEVSRNSRRTRPWRRAPRKGSHSRPVEASSSAKAYLSRGPGQTTRRRCHAGIVPPAWRASRFSTREASVRSTAQSIATRQRTSKAYFPAIPRKLYQGGPPEREDLRYSGA